MVNTGIVKVHLTGSSIEAAGAQAHAQTGL